MFRQPGQAGSVHVRGVVWVQLFVLVGLGTSHGPECRGSRHAQHAESVGSGGRLRVGVGADVPVEALVKSRNGHGRD